MVATFQPNPAEFAATTPAIQPEALIRPTRTQFDPNPAESRAILAQAPAQTDLRTNALLANPAEARALDPGFAPNPAEAAALGLAPETLASDEAGFGALLENPIFLSFLAELGSNLDPQGVGGAVGGATQSALKAQSLSKALGKSGKAKAGNLDALVSALGADDNTLNSVKLNPDGSVASIGSTGAKVPATDQPITAQAPAAGSPDEFNAKANTFFTNLGI